MNEIKLEGRDASLIPYHLRGTHVSIKGDVISVRYKNPFTKSKFKSRQKMILLSPVTVAGEKYDHIWIQGSRHINMSQPGDKVTFFAKIGIYEHNNETKWCLKFPYQYLKIERNGRYIAI